jgi:alkylation response protein AidB-like acyl-CoA dehydrogenase
MDAGRATRPTGVRRGRADRRGLRLGNVALGADAVRLRDEVRLFISETMQGGMFAASCDSWLRGFCPEFSRMVGERGWIGMTWPERYGGHARSALDRFVVLEELLVAGAPVAAHWIADRQSGPQIHRHGTEEARELLLPAIARGECFISLGMSEAGSGSDLGSVRTSAVRTSGGWLVNGTKIWSSHAHRSHFISTLCRTTRDVPSRSAFSVLLIDLSSDGVVVQPIQLLDGHVHFAEVNFTDVFVPASMLVGAENNGWGMITSELSLERSGPERILSTYPLFRELVRCRGADPVAAPAVGSLAAELWTLRRLSLAAAAEIEHGADPTVEAALIKDLGTQFEQRVVEVARSTGAGRPGEANDPQLESLLAQATFAAPGFTLRAGTTEIMRSIVARALGLADERP